MACSSSQTFSFVEYGPSGTSDPINLQLARGLEPGMVLNVIASTNYRTRFNIKDKSDNILLRVIPRIDQNTVVFNSHLCSWGTEERSSQMPIKCGIKYCLHIAYESDGYRIFINGEELHFYKHRTENPATLLRICEGQFFLVSYKINQPKWVIRQIMNGIYTEEFDCGKEVKSCEIQLLGSNPLSWIIISGIINSDATSVDFNLKSCDDENIFHFNPRFTENCVVRNSSLAGIGWGEEERCGAMVFQQNKKFVLAIDVEAPCYKTYIDGEEYITYNHRKSPNTVTILQILNDVKLLKVIYQK